jgi:hypothetical protein
MSKGLTANMLEMNYSVIYFLMEESMARLTRSTGMVHGDAVR